MMQKVRKALSSAKNWIFSSRVRMIAAVILVLVVMLLLWKQASAKQQTPQYQTAQVTRGTIISTVTESGNVSSDSQTNVTSPTNGVVTAVYVKNGDVVAAGENLFSVKSTASPQEKDQAYADLLSSQNNLLSAQQSKQALQAALEQSRASIISASQSQTDMQNRINASQPNPSTHEQYKQSEIDLIDSQLTSARETFTATETKYNQTDNQIGAAGASEQVANLKYQATQESTVTTPIDGTIANLSAIEGTAVTAATTTTTTTGTGNSSATSSSSSSSGGSAVLVLGNFTSLYIKAPVSEVDVSKVHAGEKATITLDAFTDTTYAGTVDSVDTIGTNSSGVVTYNAYIRFIDPPVTIQPAMTASAVIQVDRRDDALSVPTTAIQTTNGQSYVRELKNGKLTQVPVTAGIMSDTDTEIISGLKEGETIVTSVTLPTTTTSTTGQTASPFSTTGRGFGGFGGGFGGGGNVRVGGTTRTGGGATRGN